MGDTKAEPDQGKCKTQQIVATKLFECLAQQQLACSFGFYFGDAKLCKHPFAASFVAAKRDE